MTAPAVDFDKLTRFRHELHQWPELGFQEHDTARKGSAAPVLWQP